MATHASTLAQKIPWMEELGSGYCPQGRKESGSTERLHFTYELLVVACGIQFLDQGQNLNWECSTLASGPPGKSLKIFFLKQFLIWMKSNLSTFLLQIVLWIVINTKKSLPNTMSQGFSVMFSSSSCIVLACMFRTINYFKLIFLYV